MFKAIDFTETKELICPFDPDPGNPTRFEVGPIPGRVMDKIQDDMVASAGDDIIEAALKKQKGEVDEEGEEIPVDEDGNVDGKTALRILKPFGLLREMVTFGLKGIKNPKDDNGKEMPGGLKFYSGNRNVAGRQVSCVSDKTIDAMDRKLIQWLGTKILNFNSLDEVDKGN